MRIEFDEANKILRSNNGKPCKQHDWVEEVHNGSKTGDYRCKNCGATIYEQEYKQQNKRRYYMDLKYKIFQEL